MDPHAQSPRPSNLSYPLLVSTALLIAIGLLALYAASAMKAAELYGNPYYYLEKQLYACLVGLALIAFFRWIPFGFIEKIALPLLVASLLSLLLIFLPGAYKTVGGAARWLNLGFTYAQPSELAKLALIFFLAKNLSRPNLDASRLSSGILPNLLILLLVTSLLMLQPDFGTSVLLFAVTFLMLFIAGATSRFIAASGLLGAAIAGVAIISAPYRWKRLTSFIDPWNDFKTGGFQIIQSYLGFQNGGLLGVGLGESRQKLFFLPEAHTDFILAVIGEEMGLLGTLIISLLYYNVIRIGFTISLNLFDPFKKLLAFGLTALIALQSAFNLGVVMGILPTKGIPLPFISSGLSSLIAFMTAIAVLARLAQETPISHEARSPKP